MQTYDKFEIKYIIILKLLKLSRYYAEYLTVEVICLLRRIQNQ